MGPVRAVHVGIGRGVQLKTTVGHGVAQGSPISPALANYFLSDFERAPMIRYAGDVPMLCASDAEA